MSVEVVPNPAEHRYEAWVDGTRAGFTVVHERGGRHLFVHTEIDPAHEGEGVGSELVRGALDAMRAQGARIVPLCPFVAGWIERHPDYDDLVDHQVLDRLS